MDELTLLRSARSDIPQASDEVLDRGRAALFDRIETTSAIGSGIARKSRIRWAGAGIGLAGATALVVGLVATNVLGVAGWRGGAEPAAAEVLRSAALAALKNSDPVLAPGQYLRIDTAAVYGATTQLPGSGEDASYLTISHDELYVPADRTDDWVWVRGLSEPYETFGPESERAAESDQAAKEAENDSGDAEIVRAPRGAFYSHEHENSPDRLAGLPREPEALLEHIYAATSGQGNSPDGTALAWIADLLRLGAVPADLRAALYNTAAMIPGVEITDRQANLNGATGIAIGRLEQVNGIRQDIIIDPTTGALIGERQVLTRGEELGGYPIGTVQTSTAITTTVVDTAPAGGTPNGALDDMGCEVTGPASFQCPTEGEGDE